MASARCHCQRGRGGQSEAAGPGLAPGLVLSVPGSCREGSRGALTKRDHWTEPRGALVDLPVAGHRSCDPRRGRDPVGREGTGGRAWEPRQEGDRGLVFAKGGCFAVRVLDGTQARHRLRITWAIESARGHLPRLPRRLWPEAASDAAGIKFRHVLSFLSSVTCDVCVCACLFYGTACFPNSL